MAVTAQCNLADESTERRLPTCGGAFAPAATGHGLDADGRLVPFAAHEAMSLPAAWANAGYILFENRDATNFVTIGIVVAAVYYPVVWIPPLGKALLGAATKDLYWKADTANCWVQFWALER